MITDISGPPEEETGGRLTIDLAALRSNWRLLDARAGRAECAAVVKGDAYGIGIEPAGRALWEAGARTFFVAHLFEARALRAVLRDAVIYVLNGLAPGGAQAFADIDARPVLGSLPEIDEWAKLAQSNGLSGEAAIHIDTGMNRLGLALSQAERIVERFSDGNLGFQPSLIMSHLACGEDADHPLTQRQIEAFANVASRFRGVPASLANSSATLAGGGFAFDLCRPGIALYGGNPIIGDNPMRPVVRLDARVLQIRAVDEGDSVGYGAGEVMLGPSVVAILSVGYADGFLRAAGSSDFRKGADAIVAGVRCPLVGRVSMDLIAVDVTALPDGAVQRGDYATLIGDGITVDEVAERAGTIGYEVLTRLGRRFSRVYVT